MIFNKKYVCHLSIHARTCCQNTISSGSREQNAFSSHLWGGRIYVLVTGWQRMGILVIQDGVRVLRSKVGWPFKRKGLDGPNFCSNTVQISYCFTNHFLQYVVANRYAINYIVSKALETVWRCFTQYPFLASHLT